MTIDFYAKHSSGFTIKSNLEAFTFPGGEPHVRDNQPSLTGIDAQIAIVRAADPKDLFTLALWAEVARSRKEPTWIAMPYLPFARADRGTPFAAEVFAEFMKETVVPDKLVALDPHSPVIVELLPGLLELDLREIVKNAIGDREYAGVIAPDRGAHGRAYWVAEYLGLQVFQAGKKRNFETGKLSGFECETLPDGRFLLVDDICDGGGTFIGLAQELAKSQGITDDDLDLWVSHGIFSKGLSEITEYFGTIFTTDSWTDTTKFHNTSYLKITNLDQYTFGALSNA